MYLMRPNLHLRKLLGFLPEFGLTVNLPTDLVMISFDDILDINMRVNISA